MYSFFLISTILKVALSCRQESSIPNSMRIVGGEDTTIEEHPYQVSIRTMFSIPIYGKHDCGGSLIKLNVVLTAAHCMVYAFKVYSVKAGSKFIAYGGEILPIVRYLNHHRYNSENNDYDVSIVVLNGTFHEGPTIRTIKIMPINMTIPVGTMATISGWGKVSGYEIFSEVLKQVEVPKSEHNKCKKIYHDLGVKVENRMTCYGLPKGGKDACSGDSGGPLVTKPYQVGIISSGIGCGNVPGLYTNLENKEIRHFIFSNSKKY